MNVLSLTRGRPVEVSDMITTILIRLKEPRGEDMPLGVADEPIVIVKRLTDDAYGDISRGENKTKVQQVLALGRKAVVKVKGGTCKQSSNQNHETCGEVEKKGVQSERLQPTEKRVRDVYILQKDSEEVLRNKSPISLINRKEVVQWNN